MQEEQIFYDPSGKRKKQVAGIGAAAGFLIAITTTLFAFTLLIIPFIPPIPGLNSISHHTINIPFPKIPQEKTRLSRYLLHNSKVELWEEIKKEKSVKHKPSKKAHINKIVAGYYAPWEETGLNSFRANAGKLTDILPAWLKLNNKGDDIDTVDWDPNTSPHNLDVVNIAQANNVRIEPVISNSVGDLFDPERVHKFLSSNQNQKKIISSLKNWLVKNKFQGIHLDFENLFKEDYQKLPEFIKLLKKSFLKDSLSISMALEVSSRQYLFKDEDIINYCNFFVLMVYDEHYSSSFAGPISSIGWYNNALNETLKSIPPEKLVIGIGNYAYDWPKNRKAGESVTYQSAIILARDYTTDSDPEKNIIFDPDALNPTFNYVDDNNIQHEVWMLDALTAYNQSEIAKEKNIAGFALWDLGSEDPSLWKFYNKSKIDSVFNPDSLQRISFPYEIEFDGEGEVLAVEATSQRGYRSVTVDNTNGLITDEQYEKFPSSFVIKRRGYIPKNLTLTFDDGPDPVYTPQILDELKKLNVHATFFVIGENAEKYPSLIKRIWDEGHLIGNHTFTHPNTGAVSVERVKLELNTTQRALQSITGHSTILFRPPYNADAEPTSAEEVKPIIEASQMGYITIGEMIDPQDWNLWATNDQGEQVKRNAGDIEESILHDAQSVEGSVILLHDGGGDRSNTVKALSEIVPELRKMGYNFVDLTTLIGKDKSSVMPLLGKKDQILIGLDRPMFETIFTFEKILSYIFILAVILGILRILFVTALALIKKLRTKRKIYKENFKPPVSVLIAAYNEEKVICKTIKSALDNDYPGLEIIIVDDGSTDGTSTEIEKYFHDDKRVILIKQNNSGKATALNKAIEIAHGEIYICLDADTQILHDAITLLVKPFADPKIGAVAGNVKVGNRINILTRWQAIEYITSQNIDRQGYSLLNAITVVPGAIGAWRSSAIKEAGGYITDTLAEDMDLTWRLRRNGWKVETETKAVGFTEAPDTIKTFFKQRFRWSFGTFQCLWKHRSALFRYGWFGGLALPSLWIFQIFFQVIAPLVDLQIIYTLVQFFRAWFTQGIYTQDWQPLPQTMQMLEQVGFFYVLLFLVELIGAFIAFKFDKEKFRLLWWLFLQRFVYRQLMYAVVIKSVIRALTGKRQGWGKLQRKATVTASN